VNIDLTRGIDSPDRFHPDSFTSATTQFYRACKKKMKPGVKKAKRKGQSDGDESSGKAYRRVCSLRFVFLDPGFDVGEDDSIAGEFFL